MKNYKNILKHFISGTILIIIFIVPLFLMAQGSGTLGEPNPGSDDVGKNPSPVSMNIKIINPFKHDTIPGLINTIIDDILIPIGSVIAVVMIMWAGFKYVTARGDSKQVGEATEALKYAVIGAAILLGAKIISVAIDKTIQQLK